MQAREVRHDLAWTAGKATTAGRERCDGIGGVRVTTHTRGTTMWSLGISDTVAFQSRRLLAADARLAGRHRLRLRTPDMSLKRATSPLGGLLIFFGANLIVYFLPQLLGRVGWAAYKDHALFVLLVLYATYIDQGYINPSSCGWL